MNKFSILVLTITILLLCGCSPQKGLGDKDPASKIVGSAQEDLTQNRNDKSSANSAGTQVTVTVPRAAQYVTIKYRDTPVDVAAPYFEYLNTDKSSFIRGAWYDKSNRYMVINFDGVYYHYCGIPDLIWQNFKKAESFGRFYQEYIKGQYDCRQGYVPNY